MKIRIRGHWWKLWFKKPKVRNALGLCDWTERTLHVQPNSEVRKTLIHEVLHATYPDMAEDAIVAGEESIENALVTLEKYLSDRKKF